ncbi:hypothetical protein PHYSODRAFT_471460 [Phytophthora sojae]|uniref:Uncharacterized protein n=1 Tax=Phytophthora sojae (strain P6497) TaxID=1094619 RepID=G4YHV6_PHYSP|nr:hypothetical protein PHYSODRAFT_471460 [Phytophthora sojae]EGZ29683.1 hypothetical protein PHYSODRAFT_471460 [Phytophthora sojae]|eukprot:XP_009516958.1 hypothetical protein PHYSODRAFT_471460 [Phytophthora sojae]
MLPKLSKARSVKFQTAEPEPAFITARRNALQDLTNINAIHVSCAVCGWGSPSVRIERELEEFIDLRDHLYNIMFAAHYRQYYKFCLGVLDSVISGVDPGGFFFTLFGEERAARKLTKFVEDLVEPTLQHACANTHNCCAAQIWVPQSIHAFLFTDNNSRLNSNYYFHLRCIVSFGQF